jgi:hypothetical protein
MKSSGSRTRSTFGLAGFLLVLVAALGAQAEPPSSKLPGRKPDSTEPWDAFLGRAAHFAIGRQYSVQHPTNAIFLDTVNLYRIVEEGKLGNPKRLSELVRLLRPDITDTRALVFFEIKPDNKEGRKEGREQAGRYLAALNEAVEPVRERGSTLAVVLAHARARSDALPLELPAQEVQRLLEGARGPEGRGVAQGRRRAAR